LGVSSIWSLNDKVSVVDQVKVSMRCQCCNNVEISFDIKSKSFIELSFSWFTLPFVSIDDIKLLVDFSMFVVNNDFSAFTINSSRNI
jgi:hypothetical protein